jgi:aspartate/methionine/tyrosine aminotransferase
MTERALRSDYMHWAKNQRPVLYHLAGSEVAHFRLDRLRLAVADLELDGASRHRYPPLRAAIGAKEGVAPDCVVAADGASMANMLAMAALIAPGDEVLVEHPTYEPLLAVARFLGARITRFRRRPADGFALDPAHVARAASPATRLIVITNLHNPSGALAGEETLRQIGALGPYVLVDEVYRDAAFDAAPRSAFHLGDNFVCTNSLTKVYGLSGLRCGWILAAPPLAEAMWRLNELFGVAQAHAAERLGCIALARLGEVAADTPALLARNRALADRFFAARSEVACAPMRGITAFPRLVRGDPEALDERLRARYDTSIVPGRWFEMPDHFRIGVGGPTAMVEEGLARLGAALDELR